MAQRTSLYSAPAAAGGVAATGVTGVGAAAAADAADGDKGWLVVCAFVYVCLRMCMCAFAHA